MVDVAEMINRCGQECEQRGSRERVLISAREEEVDWAAGQDKEGIEAALGHCNEKALRAKIGVVEVVGVRISGGCWKSSIED